MSIVSILARFAEIPAADDANLARMGLAYHLTKGVVPRRNIRAYILELHLAGIESRDAAGRHHEHIGVEAGHVGDELFGVERGIRFAQIGLQPTDRFGHPPARLFGWRALAGQRAGFRMRGRNSNGGSRQGGVLKKSSAVHIADLTRRGTKPVR
jgi:hypothetical protein